MSIVSLTIGEKTRLFEGLNRLEKLEKRFEALRTGLEISRDADKLITMPVTLPETEIPEPMEIIKKAIDSIDDNSPSDVSHDTDEAPENAEPMPVDLSDEDN